MGKKLFNGLIIFAIMCWSQGSYARCEVDPGDRDCNNFDWVLTPNKEDSYNVNIGDDVVLLKDPGTYSFNLNGGVIVVCGVGDFIFSEKCVYNGEHTIFVNSGANVTINGLQSTFNLVNRGHVTIKPLSGREQIINLNSSSKVVNAGELTIEGDLRIDASFTNLSKVDVKGSLWLNSNLGCCLADRSIINVEGSSHINSAILGDGGCLHSSGLVSVENNFVVNSGNKITPIDQLVYICSEGGFSSAFNYDSSKEENFSGGAVLQDNCSGCFGAGDSEGDTDKDNESQNNYSIRIYGDTIVCQNSSTSLGVEVEGGQGDNYTYRWVKVVDGKEYEVSPESGASRFTVYPTEITVYRVYVIADGIRQIGYKDVVIYVMSASAFLSLESSSVVLTASSADAYLWSTGERTPYIKVPLSETERKYIVDLTKDNKVCKAEVIVNNLDDKDDNQNHLEVIINGPTLVCKGSSVALSAIVSGGSGEYEYEWNTGAKESFISDEIVGRSEYCVNVKDKKLGLAKLAYYVVEIPSIQVMSEEEDEIIVLVNGVEKSYSPIPKDSMIVVGLEGGNECKLNIFTGENGIENDSIPNIIVDDNGIMIEEDTIYICKGESLRLRAEGIGSYRYNWLGIEDSDSTSKEIIVAPNRTTTYILNVRINESRNKIIKKTIVVRRAYHAIVETENQKKLILQGVGGSNYLWEYQKTSDEVYKESYEGNPLVINYPAKVNSYRVNIDNVCFDTIFLTNTEFSVEITDEDSLVVDNSYVCLNGSDKIFQLSVKTSDSIGNLSYQWFRNGVLVSTESTISVSEKVSSVYQVIVTDIETGRKATASRSIIVMSAKINRQNEKTAELIANGGGIYRWSNGANTKVINVPADVSQNYTVEIIRDGNQCSIDLSVTRGFVSTQDTLDVIISSNLKQTSICEGSSITLKAEEINGTGRYSYSWNIADETQNHAQQISIKPRESKNYVVYVKDLLSGAIGIDSFYVNVLSVDVDSFSLKDSIILKAKGGDSYLWSNNQKGSYIKIPKSEDVTQYSVKIRDQFGEVCEQNIDISKSSIFGESKVTISATSSIICQGDSVTLSANIIPECKSCTYQWVNKEAYSMPNIVVSPRHSETYTVNVLNKETKQEYSASYRIEVMKAVISSLEEGREAILTASGGTSYVWSTGETAASIVVPASDSVYSVEITRENVKCVKTIYTPNQINFEDLDIRIEGNTEICPNTSTTLTVKFGDDDLHRDEFDVFWKNYPNSGRSIDISPSHTDEYEAVIRHIPTGRIYSTLTAKVVVLNNCYSSPSEKDSIQNIDSLLFVPECGDIDIDGSNYLLKDAIVLAENDLYNLNNNSNYYLGAMTPNKTYQIANLPSSSILYVHSDETIRLKIADFSGTLIFSGSGTISIEGMWTKNCSMNNEAKMLINKGTKVVLNMDNNEYSGFSLNNNSRLYNRGDLIVKGSLILNNNAKVVNLGRLTIDKSLIINNSEQIKVTNYGVFNINKLGDLNNSYSGMISLEIGSVTNVVNIGSINGSNGVICGSGCLHYSGNVVNVNVSSITEGNIEVCRSENASASSKWGTSVFDNCSSCQLKLVPINKVVCDTLLGSKDSVLLEVFALGGSGSYNYKWISPTPKQGTLEVGSTIYPITCQVELPSNISKPFAIAGTLVVSDANNPSLIDTVTVEYVIEGCGNLSDDSLSRDSFSVDINGSNFICLGSKTRLDAKLVNAPSGIISYLWSTNEKTDMIVVSPSVDSTYWVEAVCNHNGEQIKVRKEFRIIVENCGVDDSCGNNLWINIEKYPDCYDNGEISLSADDSELLSDSSVTWYNSDFKQIARGFSLKNVPEGEYYVEVHNNNCQIKRNIKLKSVDNRTNSGLLFSTYGTVSSDLFNGCIFNEYGSVSKISSFSADLSTIDANYITWTGFITITCEGEYIFTTNVKGGNLFINKDIVISSEQNRGKVSLSAGSYMIAYVVKREKLGDSDFKFDLMWETPCVPNVNVPVPTCVLTADPLVGLISIINAKGDIEELKRECNSFVVECQKPIVNIPPLQQICKEGSAITLSTSTPGATYEWKFNGEVISKNNSISVKNDGFYTVDVTSWCGSKISKDVLVQTLKIDDVSVEASTDVACYGTSVVLKATGGTSYAWSPSKGLSDPYSPNPTFIADRSQIFTVKVNTVGGCVISKSVDVKVKEPFDFYVEQEFEECNSSKVHLIADGADEYQWYPTEGLSCEKCSSTELVLNFDEKTFIVEGMKNGCVLKKNVTVRSLIKESDLSFSPDTISGCQADLSALDLGSNVLYQWTVVSNPDLVAEGKNVSLYFPSEGIYKVTLTVRRRDCDKSSSVSLTKNIYVTKCNPCNPCDVK